VIDQWQPVAEDLERLPEADLLCCVEVLQSIAFEFVEEFGEVVVECVEDRIQVSAFCTSCWCGIPEFHTPILFEDMF
jgi:hypothetical protein